LDIVIGIPAYNEEEKIASIILKLKKITDKIIVCNDGSSDMTGQIARSLGAIVIEHPKNMGYGAGIRSIFLMAKEIHADILVTFDADGQHRTDDIQPIMAPILEDKADIVIGSRFLEKNEQMPEYRKLGIKIITKLTNASMNDSLTDSQSGFRAYNRKVLDNIVPSDYGMGVSTEILIKSSKKEFRIAEVPIVVSYEGKTSTHHPVSHGVSVIMSTIKYTSIEHPLKFYGIPAIVFLTVGLALVSLTIQNYADHGRITSTNIALIGASTTVLGVILFIAAILLYSLINVVRENNTR